MSFRRAGGTAVLFSSCFGFESATLGRSPQNTTRQFGKTNYTDQTSPKSLVSIACVQKRVLPNCRLVFWGERPCDCVVFSFLIFAFFGISAVGVSFVISLKGIE